MALKITITENMLFRFCSYGFYLVSICRCFRKQLLCKRVLLHWLHWYGWSPVCVSRCLSWEKCFVLVFHIHYIGMVSLYCEFWDDLKDYHFLNKICDTCNTDMVSLQCDLYNALQVYFSLIMACHTGCIGMVFPLCEFSCGI